MHHFSYRNGVLHAEDVSIADIASAVGTPFYCYSTATLQRHYAVLSDAFAGDNALICFAVKANSNQAVLRTLADLGAGMDVVSVGELKRARSAGVSADKIIFAGVGKTREEMAYALNEGILGFNVESAAELHALSEVAAGLGTSAKVALRVNPDVDAKTHAKISTGKAENKFGIPFETARETYAVAAKLPGIEVSGIHMHIGSQITILDPFRDAFRRLAELASALRDDGHQLKHLDLGGGLGVPYEYTNDIPPHPTEYAAVVRESLGHLGLKYVFEPGRMIAANAGIFVTKVVFSKSGGDRTFTIIDGAMNDLIRPTLYEAYHDIWPVAERQKSAQTTLQDVVGPVCETGDFLAEKRMLPQFSEGDLMAVMSAGAYGAVMSSTYNTRALVPEVLVKGDAFAVVRPRLDVDDIIAMDQLAPWMTS
ncbi:MAG: diaminopimelate decarboxylase [Pseudomonadota bacterium]